MEWTNQTRCSVGISKNEREKQRKTPRKSPKLYKTSMLDCPTDKTMYNINEIGILTENSAVYHQRQPRNPHVPHIVTNGLTER